MSPRRHREDFRRPDPAPVITPEELVAAVAEVKISPDRPAIVFEDPPMPPPPKNPENKEAVAAWLRHCWLLRTFLGSGN